MEPLPVEFEGVQNMQMPLALPVDLWIDIIEKSPKKDLPAIARTCRPFHAIAQVELYRNIELRGFNDTPRKHIDTLLEQHPLSHSDILSSCCLGPFERNQMSRLVRTLVERPEVARLVRNLTYDYHICIKASSSTWSLPQQHPILKHLPSFSNLRSLGLGHVDIDAELYSVIRKLPRLTSVMFELCNLIAFPDISPIPGIMDVAMVDPIFNQGWTAVVPERIQSLELEVFDKMYSQLPSFISHGSIHALTSLDIYTNSNNIVPFLNSSPQLRRIRVGFISEDIHTLPANSIPLLETFSGPADLCEVFVVGRPIHTAELRLHQHNRPNDILALRRSTAPVTDLEFKFNFGFEWNRSALNVFLPHAPNTLHSLSWDSVEKGDMMSSISHLASFPELHTLRGSVFIDIAEGHRSYTAIYKDIIVPSVSAANTLVREIHNTRDGVRWLKFDGKWEPHATYLEVAQVRRKMEAPCQLSRDRTIVNSHV